MNEIQVAPAVFLNRDQESSGRKEGYSGDFESVGEAESVAEKEIRDESHRGVGVGVEPLENRVVEIGEGVDDGEVAVGTEILDVLYARGYFGVRRKWED